jgi:hypothetical protein
MPGSNEQLADGMMKLNIHFFEGGDQSVADLVV